MSLKYYERWGPRTLPTPSPTFYCSIKNSFLIKGKSYLIVYYVLVIL